MLLHSVVYCPKMSTRRLPLLQDMLSWQCEDQSCGTRTGTSNEGLCMEGMEGASVQFPLAQTAASRTRELRV